MDENRIKELYEAEINNSAPDFDKLWEKIDSNLTEKKASTPEISITPKKSHLNAVKTIAALAAGLALVAFVPSLFSSDRVSLEATAPSVNPSAGADSAVNFAPSEDSVVMDEAANDSVYEEEASDSVCEEEVSDSESEMSESGNYETESVVISYEDLPFNSYSETILTCTGTPYGSEYFLEEDVLSSADYIVSAVVMDVYRKDDGSAICYELETSVSYPEKMSETIIVESCSTHTMKRGREYLIPVAKTAEGYRTVYDNIPQIEFTADGGLVYYNGWTSLDNDDSQSIIYPERTVDDFFYDRMKFSYSGDYSALIEKFYDAKDL